MQGTILLSYATSASHEWYLQYIDRDIQAHQVHRVVTTLLLAAFRSEIDPP